MRKYFFFFIINIIFLVTQGCSLGGMKFEDAMTPIDISTDNIRDFNEIQNWLGENKEGFIDTALSQENTYYTEANMRYNQSYSLPSRIVEKIDITPPAIMKHSSNHKNKMESFIISNIEYRPHDAMTTYIIFQKTFGEKLLIHKISNEALPEDYNYTFHFKLDDEWHYTITAHTDDE